MTVPVAGRTVIDLNARASVLEAVERIADAPAADDLVLTVAAGAPVARSAVFFEVARRSAGSRRLAIVTADARARSLASAVHVPAFASVAALERHELDATEPLTAARRAALARPVRVRRQGMSPARLLGIGASLLAAGLVLTAVVAPTATVVVAPVSTSLGPLEFDLRAGPAGGSGAAPDINALTLVAPVTTKFTANATGSRTDETKAKGVVRFTSQVTQEQRIAKGTIVQTRNGIAFQTTEDKTLPRSEITITPPFVRFGTVDVAIEALQAGPGGNVPANTITVGSSNNYSVNNPTATSGGDSKKIPIVTRGDYDLAATRADDELAKEGSKQVERWKQAAAKGQLVYGAITRRSALTPAGDVVGKEGQPSFELTVSGTATGYSVVDTEPRATTITKLRQHAESENDIDPEGAVIDLVVGPSVAEDGVHWRVRGRASQFPRVQDAVLRAALAGHAFDEAQAVVDERGLRLLRVTLWPGWWPRLPVLDSRIEVRTEAPASAASP